MVKSRKKRNLQSRKKYQKRNYRVRLSSKKRNLRRNNKVVSRKRPKRYQRGGSGAPRRSSSSIAAIGERAVAGGLVGGILLLNAFRKAGRGLKKGYRVLRRKRAPRLSQETMASRALNNLFLKEMELVLSSRRDKLEFVSEEEGFKFKFLIKPPENYQNPEKAEGDELAYFNPYSDNLEGRIYPPLDNFFKTMKQSKGTALFKKTTSDSQREGVPQTEDPFEIGGGAFGSIVIGVNGTKSEGDVKDLEVSAVKLIKIHHTAEGGEAARAKTALQNEYNILLYMKDKDKPGKIHIIRSFLDGIGGDITYLPLELFGCDLKDWVSQGVSHDKLKIGMPNYLSYDMVIKFLGQIHKGILYLQELGVIHFDLAARNILISQLYTLDIEDLDYLDNIDSYFLLKITDFGLAKTVGQPLPIDMPLPLRWLNPNFLKLSSDQVGFKNIDMWSLVCIGIEMVSRGETPYNTGSFNKNFADPNFRTPENLATSILATVFERYLISSPDERRLIETNLGLLFTELITENPVGIEPINEFFGNLFYNRRPLPPERLTRSLVADPVSGEGGGITGDLAPEEPRTLQGVETPIGKADFISYELRHKCVLPFPLQAFEKHSSLLGVQFGSTVLLCNKDGNTLKTFVDVGIGDKTTKRNAILLRPRSESREGSVKGVLYEYEERLDEGRLPSSVSITEVELTRGPTGKVGNTAGSEEIVANFDYDTKMVMSETEFTEGFTLPVDGREAGEAPVQYVTLSESIADPTKDAELYAPIEAEINRVLTDKGFYSHIALVQDESGGESLVDPTCVEPGFQIPVKNGFYVPQSGNSTPFGPIEYNTSEGTIIVQGVKVTEELARAATEASGAPGAPAGAPAVATKLNKDNTIITLSTDIQRKIKTINVKRENFIDIEFELEPDISREEPPSYSIKKPTPSKPSLEIRNSRGESAASPRSEPTFDPRGFSLAVQEILAEIPKGSSVQILRLDDDVLTYKIDGRTTTHISGGSYKKKSKKKSKRGRKRSLKQRGGAQESVPTPASSPGFVRKVVPISSSSGQSPPVVTHSPPVSPETPRKQLPPGGLPTPDQSPSLADISVENDVSPDVKYGKLNPTVSRRFIRKLTSRVTYSLEHEKRFNDFTEKVLVLNNKTKVIVSEDKYITDELFKKLKVSETSEPVVTSVTGTEPVEGKPLEPVGPVDNSVTGTETVGDTKPKTDRLAESLSTSGGSGSSSAQTEN